VPINIFNRSIKTEKWQCLSCPYIYDQEKGDPDSGVPAGTRFEDLADDWVCPVCQVPKAQFKKIE
jgi:rubredoxin